MEVKSQSATSAGCEVLGREHAVRLHDLVKTIFPTQLPSELAHEISLQSLQAMLDDGRLPSELKSWLNDYLNSLPGYGTAGFENETERHHSFLVANVLRQFTFSFRAESYGDAARFLSAAAEALGRFSRSIINPDTDGLPDVEAEFQTGATLEQLQGVLRTMEDTHVILQTLRQLPLQLNDLERDYDLT